MIKKNILSFFVFLFCISAGAQAQSTIENSIDEARGTVSDLKNIKEKLPSKEDIDTIASAIQKISAAYQSAKVQIANAIGYSQKLIQTFKETSEKIKNDILKIKNYINDKTGFISEKYGFNLF